MSTTCESDPRRNAEGYLDLTAFEALKRAQRKTFGYRPLVYICSPYSGDIEVNVAVAREFCRVAVARRKIPFAPHLLFPQFMNDRDPGERELAVFFNRILLAHCEAVWVHAEHLSAGMHQELQWARSLGLPVKYFTTNFEEARL